MPPQDSPLYARMEPVEEKASEAAEDLFTLDHYIRITALKEAVKATSSLVGNSRTILERAAKFEAYIRDGTVPPNILVDTD